MTKFSKVALKASNGKYVTVADGTGNLQATSEKAGINETFQILYPQEDEEDIIQLMAPNGKYVSNPQDGGLPLAAVCKSKAEAEQFFLFEVEDKKFTLFSFHQKFIQLIPSESAILQTLTDEVSDLTFFEIEPLVKDDNPIKKPKEKASGKKLECKLSLDTTSEAFTVCFCGTACTRDEGEVTRNKSDKGIYCDKTGYIPVRIHKEICGDLEANSPSVIIRGVGERDWASQEISESTPLQFDAPLKADKSLLEYVKNYTGGKQYSRIVQADGWSDAALALHAANSAANSGKKRYNFIGHSRGAVESIMAAWFIFLYGSDKVKKIPINIFAIDPVPGPGEWYGIFTQLPPNVVNYVGIYAWDMCVQPKDILFKALVPRPNGLMKGITNDVTLHNSWRKWAWKYVADKAQLTDPLAPASASIPFPQPVGYELYACRGRHSTVSGNSTSDGAYKSDKISDSVAPVPELIYKMARGYLTQWGTTFAVESAVDTGVLALRQKINMFHREFDLMGGGETRTSNMPLRPYVRRLSSTKGSNPLNSYYMDNVVGNPPYKMAYPVTAERETKGWVKWKFL